MTLVSVPNRVDPAAVAASSARTPAAGAPKPGRLDWVDMSRAVAVVAVVLFHASIGHFYTMSHSQEGVVAWWDRVNQIITAVRMPLLFTISGMLAAGKIRRGFRQGKAIEAAVTNYYLYAVWLLIYGGLLLFALAHSWTVPFQFDSLSGYLREFYVPNTPLWYVFALGIYIVLFTALRRISPAIILTGLLALHIGATQLYTLESPLWTRGLTFALYFGLGVYGKRIMQEFAARPVLAALAAGASYLIYQQIGMSSLMSLQLPSLQTAGLTVALYVCAGLAMVGITGMLARVALYARLGRAIGKRTLSIYVLHIPVIVIINLSAFGPFGVLRELAATTPWLDTVYPLLITALIVPICMACQDVAPRVKLGFLFALPARLRTSIESARLRLVEARPQNALAQARRATSR